VSGRCPDDVLSPPPKQALLRSDERRQTTPEAALRSVGDNASLRRAGIGGRIEAVGNAGACIERIARGRNEELASFALAGGFRRGAVARVERFARGPPRLAPESRREREGTSSLGCFVTTEVLTP
jgi:hypothetical protein